MYNELNTFQDSVCHCHQIKENIFYARVWCVNVFSVPHIDKVRRHCDL